MGLALLLRLITPTVCLFRFAPNRSLSLNPDCTAAVHVIDFYLDDERAKERVKIFELVKKTDPASVELLQGYVREGMREPSFT